MKPPVMYKTPAIFVSLLLIGLFSLYSCEKSEPEGKEPKKIVLNKKAAEIIRADQQFAFELFREVYGLSEEDNLMISPLSVSCALGMTCNGSLSPYVKSDRRIVEQI